MRVTVMTGSPVVVGHVVHVGLGYWIVVVREPLQTEPLAVPERPQQTIFEGAILSATWSYSQALKER